MMAIERPYAEPDYLDRHKENPSVRLPRDQHAFTDRAAPSDVSLDRILSTQSHTRPRLDDWMEETTTESPYHTLAQVQLLPELARLFLNDKSSVNSEAPFVSSRASAQCGSTRSLEDWSCKAARAYKVDRLHYLFFQAWGLTWRQLCLWTPVFKTEKDIQA